MTSTAHRTSADRRLKLVHSGINATWIAAICTLFIAIEVAVFRDGEVARGMWFLCSTLAAFAICLSARTNAQSPLSPAIAYSLVFWMFHFGLVFPASIFPAILDNFDPWNISWVYSPETRKAVLESLVFLLAFLLPAARSPDARIGTRKHEVQSTLELVLVGRLALILGIAVFTLALFQHGPTVFFASYSTFFAVHNQFSWSITIIAFALILQISGGTTVKRVVKTAAWTYAPIATLTFVGGARTAPLFSAAVIGIILAKRGLKISRPGLWMALLMMLVVIGLVKETRQVGLSEVIAGGVDIATLESPVSGITELGGSLRPVSATVHYIDVAGNDLFYGQTYVYPIVRQVEALLGIPRSIPEAEPRFVSTHISLLYGAAMGYSVVAEAYANAGTLGVILFANLWGLVVSYLDRRSESPYGLALLGGVLLPMMINIRNSFIFVPGWIFLAILTLLFARVVLAPRIRRRGVVTKPAIGPGA